MLKSIRWVCLGLVFGFEACNSDTAKGPSGPVPPLRAIADPEATGYFVDGHGREVLLHGVNVNSFAEYWAFDANLPTVQPYAESDAEFLAGLGYNFVRLLVTWSRVEPKPGNYDDAYLAEVKSAIGQLWARGIYVMVDMHQDGWGPHIAARENEVCGTNEIPAGGWDGAPLWATLVAPETPRCLGKVGGYYVREFNPAAQEAWANFLVHDMAGPGGVGLQERFAAMWAHVAAAMADAEGVMGYDILNEPNTFSKKDHEGLALIYGKTLNAIRAAEHNAGIAPRVFVFEPSAAWSNFPVGSTVKKFTNDPQVAYGPHVYQGSIGLMPLNNGQLDRLQAEVRDYGGIPVVVGEWGDWPADLTAASGYFLRMIGYQDKKGWATAHWNYKSGCGDPHRYYEAYQARLDGNPWTYASRNCDMYEKPEWYLATYAALQRPALHYAPGRTGAVSWKPAERVFTASGAHAREGNELVLFLPGNLADLQVQATGLETLALTAQHGGRQFKARAKGGAWSISAKP